MLLKTELHAHTDQDPEDRIPHTTTQLIDRAAELGYHAIAVTLHDRYFDPAPDMPYARERGVLLLSGIERTIGRLKDWRRIHTRYDKLAANFASAVAIAAILIGWT